VQITGRWIHAQRVPVSGGRNALGRADRSGIEEQLRKERRAVSGSCGAGNGVKDLERRPEGYPGDGVWCLAENLFVEGES